MAWQQVKTSLKAFWISYDQLWRLKSWTTYRNQRLLTQQNVKTFFYLVSARTGYSHECISNGFNLVDAIFYHNLVKGSEEFVQNLEDFGCLKRC